MKNNLLIVGAGVYSVVAMEIAMEMSCFDEIGFVDDAKDTTPNGIKTVGKVEDLKELSAKYSHIIVAIGNPNVRLSIMKKIEEETDFCLATLISPRAYISPSAKIMKGCIIEPMAAVHSLAVISKGCIVSAGAVVNHFSNCCDAVHIDCNATVMGGSFVPEGMKIQSGQVYDIKEETK